MASISTSAWVKRRGAKGLALGQRDGHRRGLFEVAGEPHDRAFRARLGPRADEERDCRLAGALERRDDLIRDGLGRRLGNDDDDLGAIIAGERFDAHERRCAAYPLILEVAAASADRLADARSGAVDEARNFLDAGPRGADDADRTALDDIGKAQRHAIDDGGAAIGPHHQEALAPAQRLEGDLVLERHVVGEQHHVQAALQRLAGLARRVGARQRNDRQIGVGLRPQRSGEIGRRNMRRVAAHRLRLAAQRFLGGGARGVGALFRVAVDGDNEVVGRRLGQRGGVEADRAQQVEVHRRAHRDGRIMHARSLLHLLARQHEQGGVVVRLFLDKDVFHERNEPVALSGLTWREGGRLPLPLSRNRHIQERIR